MKLDFRQRLLTTTLLVGASMVASPVACADDSSAQRRARLTTAHAQHSGDHHWSAGRSDDRSVDQRPGRDRPDPQDIVITGTRIPQPNLTSASPVTVLSAQEVKLQGTTRTEDLINSLPQAFAAQGSNVSNGATGTATVNLRGLGADRTLVLINGRRLQPGDPTRARSPTSTSSRRR